MKSAFLWFSLIGFFSAIAAKSVYFPDVSDEEYKRLVAKFLRKRLVEAEAEELPLRGGPEAAARGPESADGAKPPFEYNLPLVDPSSPPASFAAAPADPRYYQDFNVPVATPFASTEDADAKAKRLRVDDPENSANLSEPFLGSERGFPPVKKVEVFTWHDSVESRQLFVGLLVLGCVFTFIAILALAYGCYKLRKNAKAAADVDYPAYGVTGPNKEISPTSGDRRLAQSAQMYHYQHQKQQIIAMESLSNKDRRCSISDAESEEDNEEGDYTVYECPGLAPTGEMEVKNPLFQDDQTPASKQPAAEPGEESQELPNLISFD